MMNFLSFTVMAWYVVHVGRRTGLFYCWEDCHAQINGFSGACYKRYNSKEEAITALKRQDKCIDASHKMETTTGGICKDAVIFIQGVVIIVQALLILILVYKLM